MYFVNGHPADSISLADRSFNYGDGCFTTILVKVGELHAWDLHQQRMCNALERLQIPSPNWKIVRQWLDQAVIQYLNQLNHEQPIYTGVKLHLSRGAGGRGYSPQGTGQAQIIIHPFAYPTHYINWQQSGIALGISNVQLGLNPLLAGLKHNNRLEQVLIKSEIDQMKYQDAVVLDIEQHVIETCASNLFWIKNRDLFTADLTRCGVEGTMKKQVLNSLSNFNLKLHVGNYHLSDLFDADQVFITNALHGVVPVKRVADKTYGIGAMTKALQEKLNS